MINNDHKNMLKIDEIFLTTTIIKGFLKDKQYSTATGFFFMDNKKNVYLITNKHVIYGEHYYQKDIQPEIDKIKIILHIDKNNLSKNEEVVIDLFCKKEKLWKEHQKSDVDVICIPLSLDRSKYLFAPIGEDLLDSSGLKIGFEKITIMGYPYGWYDSLNNLPVTRIGHLSSPFMAPFQGYPFMLGDVETHKGMSGGPVFMHLRDYITIDENNKLTTHIGAVKIILIGAFSGQPSWVIEDKKTNKKIKIPHSLSIIWFSSLIKDIIET